MLTMTAIIGESDFRGTDITLSVAFYSYDQVHISFAVSLNEGIPSINSDRNGSRIIRCNVESDKEQKQRRKPIPAIRY